MIKASNITHYYGDELALDNINLEINQGEFICLVGESGSGKSTLLSILSSLLKPSHGQLEICEVNSKKIVDIDQFRRKNIGFVFQFHYLIEYLTVLENIELATDKHNSEKIKTLLNYLEIENIQHKYPNEISGGQRQRSAIARALANQPKIIFADEPTGNLDSKNSQKVFELLKELSSQNITIVVATHDAKLAQMADKIYEVQDGTISIHN